MKKLKIGTVRMEHNWTQQEVANMLGITKASYSNIENGRRKPSYDLLIKIQKVFKDNIEHLLSAE